MVLGRLLSALGARKAVGVLKAIVNVGAFSVAALSCFPMITPPGMRLEEVRLTPV